MNYFKSLAAGLLLAAALPASAITNLVTNGDFSAPQAFNQEPSGWVVTGGTVRRFLGSDYLGYGVTAGDAASMAESFASFGSGGQGGNGSLNRMRQEITTVTGQAYDFSFDYYGLGVDGSQDLVYTVLDVDTGLDLGGLSGVVSATANTNVIATDRQTFSGSFVATGTSTAILFFHASQGIPNFPNDLLDAAIDNVSVSAVSAVPEPGEWALMLAGLGLVGAVARRRQGRVAA